MFVALNVVFVIPAVLPDVCVPFDEGYAHCLVVELEDALHLN